MRHDASSRDVSGEWARVLLSDEHDMAAVGVEGETVVAANAAATTLFARPVVGAKLRELFDPGSWGKLEAALTSGGGCELQIRGVGSAEPHAARFAVLPRADIGQLLVAKSTRGLTYSEEQGRELMRLNDELALRTRELSRRAQELADARGRLERLDALRQHYMAMLAHDLKTPLGAVRLIAHTFARGRKDETRTDRLRAMGQRLDRAVLRMTVLIDTVLAAARLEDEDLALSATPTPFETLVHEAFEALEPLAHERRLVMACDAGGDTTASVDATWMGQVLANLLSNAIRHAPERSTVRVSLDGDGARVRCAVADRGPGIPPELRAVVFERFRQAGSRPGSAGLGLYVSQRLVAMHRGRIWVEEAAGGGARFCFEVPRFTTSR
jgi:signal transduction histidine kinase